MALPSPSLPSPPLPQNNVGIDKHFSGQGKVERVLKIQHRLGVRREESLSRIASSVPRILSAIVDFPLLIDFQELKKPSQRCCQFPRFKYERVNTARG